MDEAELSRAVAGARRVKVAGAGHSFTDIACTDGVMLDLSRMNRVLAVDGRLVTVEAGITIRELGPALAARGLALENQGDVDPQTIAGAISTATHGTGGAFANISSQVTGMRVVTADGEARRASRGRRSAGGPGLARRAGRHLGGDAALRARLQDPSCRRARAARRCPRIVRPAGGGQRPLRAVRLSLHADGAHAHLGAHRPQAAARRSGQSIPARPDAGERGAGARLSARAPLSGAHPAVSTGPWSARCRAPSTST